MPKSSSLTSAIHADEHIGRLDIPVHDQVRVRVGDGLQHVEKQTDARLDPERVLVAVAVDGLTVHVLEDEVRLARCRYTRIDEASDVRVRHLGEKIAFAPESLLAGAAHSAMFSSLTATRPSKRPSQRSASQTLPIPPWPMSEISR